MYFNRYTLLNDELIHAVRQLIFKRNSSYIRNNWENIKQLNPMRPNIKLSSNLMIQQRLKEIIFLYGNKTWMDLLHDLTLAGDKILYEKLADGYRNSRIKYPLTERVKMLKILVEDLLETYENKYVSLDPDTCRGSLKIMDKTGTWILLSEYSSFVRTRIQEVHTIFFE